MLGRVTSVGAGGSGEAANQHLVAGTLGLVAKALVFLDAQDVDAEAAIKVLSGGEGPRRNRNAGQARQPA